MPVNAGNTPSSRIGYAAPRSPPNILALPFWLDGFNLDGQLTANASLADDFPVVLAKNKGTSGATLDLAQSTAGAKPIFVNGRNPAGINGHPALLFAAAKSMAATASMVALQAARHIFVVSKILAARTGYYFVPRSTPVGAYALFGLGADSNIVEWNSINSITTVGAAPAAGFAIIEYSFDGVTSNVMTMVINGVAQVVTNPPGTENATAGMLVGQGFPGPIGEILGYNAVQTLSVVADARSYLLEKWSQSTPLLNSAPTVFCMFLGDSLTYGLDDETTFGGYRGPLCDKNPRLFPFGLRTDGGVPAPKDHHQGTSGTTTTVVLANISSFLDSAPRLDCVLLNLGTNFDEANDAASAANMVAIIRAIFSRFPACKVFVMRIGIFSEAALLARAAILLSALGVAFPSDPRVIWVNPTPLTLDADYWSGDGVHPNHGGYLVLANFWAQALAANGFGP